MTFSSFAKIGTVIRGEGDLDLFGISVSLSSDGSVLAIGAPGNDENGAESGHVRIYKKANNTWTQIGSDIDGEKANDQVGYRVSLSDDGSVVAIVAMPLAPQNLGNAVEMPRGLVRIYKNVNNTWEKIGGDIDGEAVGDFSGWSVSLSNDGTVVAIGAFKNNGNGTDSGHVRIFEKINNTWTQIGSDIDGEAAGDYSAWSVSLSNDGSVLAIGAPGNDGNGESSGHVRIYKKANNTWTQIGSDIDGEAASDHSGRSVSLSADGSVVAIGADFNDANGIGFTSGHVRIYKNENNTWTQIGSDIDGEIRGSQFGWSVSLSNDGSIVAISSLGGQLDYRGMVGYVSIYKNFNNNWKKVGDNIYGETPSSGAGRSFSLSADGSVVAIGAYTNETVRTRNTISGEVSTYQINYLSDSDSVSEGYSSLSNLEAYNYIASYGDLINAFGIDIEAAKSHYENYGISEGRSLTSFSATNYLAKYSDLSAAFGDDETSALKHYIQYGFNEGRTDTSSSSVSGSGSGSSSGESSNLTDFQALNYIASNIDLISALGTDLVAAKSHYTNYGKAEGRPVDNFDEWGYLASNNDLMGVFGSNTTEAVKHYISYGKSEGRSATIFNAQSYLNNYADLKSAFGNDQTLAAKHYVESGFNEGRVF